MYIHCVRKTSKPLDNLIQFIRHTQYTSVLYHLYSPIDMVNTNTKKHTINETITESTIGKKPLKYSILDTIAKSQRI